MKFPIVNFEGGWQTATKVARHSMVRERSIVQRNAFDLFQSESGLWRRIVILVPPE